MAILLRHLDKGTLRQRKLAGPFRILDIVGLTTAYNIGILDPRSKDPNTVQGKITAKLKEKMKNILSQIDKTK